MTVSGSQQSRDSIIVIFDHYYSSHDNLVGAYLHWIIANAKGIRNVTCVTKEPYHGAPIKAPANCKIRFVTDADAAKFTGGIKRGLWKWLKKKMSPETSSFWTSNLTGDFEGIARLLFDAERYHAVICFTQSPPLGLAVARLAHVFSDKNVPHLFCISRKNHIPKEDLEDFSWLGMQLLHDGELIPSIDNFKRPHNTYLFVRPFTRMATKAVGSFIAKKVVLLTARIGRRRPNLHLSETLHDAYRQRIAQKISKKAGNLEDAPNLVDLHDAISGFTPLSFFDNQEFPFRGDLSIEYVKWNELLDHAKPYPLRIKNIVLFARPDWDASGGATAFNSLKTYFRNNNSICIEIGIWPYFVPFSEKERRAKLAASEKNGRTAISFFVRRSASIGPHFRAMRARRRLKPKTLTGELLLYYVGAAMPAFMVECLENARINTIFINHYFTQEYMRPFIKGRKYYMETQDIQATNAVHLMYRNPITTKLDSFDKMFAEELEYLRWPERLSFLNSAEVEMVRPYLESGRVEYFVPLPIIDTPSPVKAPESPFKIIFVASDNLANRQSLNWFLQQIWPRVLAMADSNLSNDFVLSIIGDIKNAFSETTAKNIKFVGRVDNLEEAYAEADLVLLPVLAGGGVAIKTLEAILYHKPFVATHHALRGLPEGIRELLQPVDNPKDFASRIVIMVSDAKARNEHRALAAAAAAQLLKADFYGRLTKSLDAVRLDSTS